MKPTPIWDMIEYDGDDDEDGHYNQEALDAILECVEDEKKLEELSPRIRVGDTKLENYIGYFKRLRHHFSLTGNIVECACGQFPIMSFLIDAEQRKQGKGTIRAYDKPTSFIPNSVMGRFHYKDKYLKAGKEKFGGLFIQTPRAPLGNIDFRYEYIEPETDIGKCDLIFGVYTCMASINLVNKANSLGANFFLGMCDCGGGGDFRYLYDYIKKTMGANDELIVEAEHSHLYPIFIVKRKE